MNNTCFVIMPIGTQIIGGITLSEEQLREKYDYIIKNAILKADPTLEVIRADEELNPGSISNDIFIKLMHSKYVIADITYPNPNVFYELGIRHAIKSGTILIREKVDFSIPFDISHLRHIEYTQAPSGMDKLSTEFKKRFDFYDKNPVKPDNQFLELCKFTNYEPISYARPKYTEEAMQDFITLILSNKNLAKLLLLNDKSFTKEECQKTFLDELNNNPELAKKMAISMLGANLIE